MGGDDDARHGRDEGVRVYLGLRGEPYRVPAEVTLGGDMIDLPKPSHAGRAWVDAVHSACTCVFATKKRAVNH